MKIHNEINKGEEEKENETVNMVGLGDDFE